MKYLFILCAIVLISWIISLFYGYQVSIYSDNYDYRIVVTNNNVSFLSMTDQNVKNGLIKFNICKADKTIFWYSPVITKTFDYSFTQNRGINITNISLCVFWPMFLLFFITGLIFCRKNKNCRGFEILKFNKE